MTIFKQFGKNVNYMAYMSDCTIEISNNHTNAFGSERIFFSQFTLKLHLAWVVSDCLLQV